MTVGFNCSLVSKGKKHTRLCDLKAILQGKIISQIEGGSNYLEMK
jgi:hypothetical protein